MIIDGPITFDLTVGADRRIPQDGDAQTEVPPIVTPVVLALAPTRSSNGGGALINSSTLIDSALTIAPSSAASFSVMQLISPGLWEFEVTQSSNFNFAMAPGTPGGCGVEFLDPILGMRTAIIFRSAQIGGFVDYNRVRVLFVKQMSLRMFFSATAAGQNIDFRALVNAIRIV